MSTITPQKMYTVQQAAAIIGITTAQTRGLCEIGRIRAIDISVGSKRYYRIPEDSLRRFLLGPKNY